MIFRALTYNLHKGRNFLSRKSVLLELKKALHDIAPDMVFLQEVMGLEKGINQLDVLSEPLNYHRAYGQNNVKQDGHYGNAILSRFPIIESSNRNISTNRFEKRGSLQAHIDMDGVELILMCLHLDLLETGRAMQVQNVIQHVRSQVEEHKPILVAGDFNDWRGRVCSVFEGELGLSNAFQDPAAKGIDVRTFPSFFPSVSLDRFYFRKLELEEIQVLRGPPWNKFSDHCPVLATFKVTAS